MLRRLDWIMLIAVLLVCRPALTQAQNSEKGPAETKVVGPHGLSIVVRMQGPYDADVPLQIVCYFQHSETSDKKLSGAPVELDRRLGGVIASLRQRGDFSGQRFESLLLQPLKDTIKARQLLLLGLGSEEDLSYDHLETIGTVALRESVKADAQIVAFAPMIKDAGNDRLPAGEVETAVVRGMLLAYDTQQRLQSQGWSPTYQLNTWIVESGPAYYEETIKGVRTAVQQAAEIVSRRDQASYSKANGH